MKIDPLKISQRVKSVNLLPCLVSIIVTFNFIGQNLYIALGEMPASSEDVVKKAAEALGGQKILQELKSVSIISDGERYEPGQKYSADEYPKFVSSFHYNLTDDLVGNKMRIEWERVVIYPYQQDLRYTVVIKNDSGFTYGKDGYFSPLQAPLLSTAISSFEKDQLISSPLQLIRFALINPDSVSTKVDEKYNGKQFHVIQLNLKKSTEPIIVLLDKDTYLPVRALTLEDDPIHGDTLVQVVFDDWKRVNGVYFPFSVVHLIHGEIIEEKRVSIDTNMNLLPQSFMIPKDVTYPNDPNDSLLGWQSSQWFLRMHSFGIPHYNRNLPVNFTRMAPGVYHVTGSTHNSLVIEMNNYTVVVEAPLYEERSKAVIHEINRLWPDKPIRYIISTHTHDDHIGGLRTYAAEGAIILSSNTSKVALDSILNAPHTIRPDELQLNKEKLNIELVSDNKTISDNNRSIEIIPVTNSHSNDMLVVYLPKEKILLDSDLYSPNSVPPPFKIYSKQLLDFIEKSGITVKTIAGTHGTFGSLSDLQNLVHQYQNLSDTIS